MNQWKERTRPNRLERRFEFQTYEETRDFLDRLGDLCEKSKRYPDVSFGKTYVNLTLQPEVESSDGKISDSDKDLAFKIDQLVS